jgi:tetratricopeptide (TPR) repeat protein
VVARRDSTRLVRVLDEAVAEELALLAVQAGWLAAGALEDARRVGLGRELARLLTAEQLETVRARQRQRDIDRLQGRVVDTPDEVRDVEGDAARRFDRFVLVERVGRGGYGHVWKAWDPQVRRWVAIKILSADSGHARERFLREAHIAGTLRHPNLVTVHDAGDWQGCAYMVMEFIEGEPLAPSATPEDLAILRDAASAMGAAHRRGVVHRDLKPANILVDASRVPHVVDFGLAREGEGSLTRTGAIIGTPLYMAPEQVEGRSDITPRTDVYALGCILYESLTGRPPHLGRTVPEVYSNLLQRDAVPPRRLNPNVAPALETICLKAIERDAALRYAHAGELAEDLDRHLRGEAVRARPAPIAVRARRAFRRHAVVAAAAVVVLASGAYGYRRAAAARACEAACDEAVRHEEAGRPLEARAAYGRAQGIDPSNARAREGLSRLAVRREEALKLIESARTALEKAQHLLYDASATPAEIAEWIDRAQPLVDKAVADAPDAALPHFVAGWAQALRGRDDRAEASWRQSLAADPNFAQAHLQLGKLYGRRAYLATLGTVLETRDAHARESQRHSEPGRRHVEAAMGAAAGVLDEMEVVLADCIVAMSRVEVDEMERRALNALAQYRARRGVEELVWVAAVSTTGQRRLDGLSEALRIRPHYPLALLCRAAMHRERGDGEAALADVDHALALHPSLVAARWERAMICWKSRRLDAADADFEECARAGWRPAESKVNQARVRTDAGRRDAAYTALEEAIGFDARCMLAYFNRANLRREDGDLAASIADLDRAIEIDPSHAPAWNNRGVARLALRDAAPALADFREAARLDPAHAMAWRNIGSILASQDDLKGALDAYDCAVAADAKYARALYERAMVRVGLRDRAKAVEDLERVLKLPQADPAVRADAEKALALLRKR